MFEGILQPTHLIILVVLALLILGPKRLPEVGRSLGSGMRSFRDSIAGEDDKPAVAQRVDDGPAVAQATATAHETAPRD